MTYREPYKRPNIQEVHSHPFVVNRPVKMNNTKIINRKKDENGAQDIDENVILNRMFNKFDHKKEKQEVGFPEPLLPQLIDREPREGLLTVISRERVCLLFKKI
jgi:hypothetical protein